MKTCWNINKSNDQFVVFTPLEFNVFLDGFYGRPTKLPHDFMMIYGFQNVFLEGGGVCFYSASLL